MAGKFLDFLVNGAKRPASLPGVAGNGDETRAAGLIET